MADERLERNWRMANAASDHIMRPANEKYRSNYDRIFRKQSTAKKTPKKRS
jgi:hypothetical protein